MTIYKAERVGRDPVVTVAGETEYPQFLLHIPVHSPGGFEWGYGGSGPADLSIAILAHHLHETKGDVLADWNRHIGEDIKRSQALKYHQKFKEIYVVNWPRNIGGQVTSEEIDEFFKAVKRYSLAELEAMPTLSIGTADNLKIHTDRYQVWLSRIEKVDGAPYDHQVMIDCYINDRWITIDQYQALEDEEDA